MIRTLGVPRRIAAAALLATGLLVLVLATTAGSSAAASFLALFRVQKFTVVTYDPSYPVERFKAMGKGLGTVSDSGTSDRLRMAGSLDEASLRVGFDVASPTALPPGVNAEPLIQTLPARQVRFTFDGAKAQQAALARNAGQPVASIPPSLDGTGLLLSVPAAAVQTYLADGADATEDSFGPALVLAQGPAPSLEAVGGASLEEIRAFLLSTPGLPAETVQQVSSIDDWANTVPVPVPDGRVAWQQVDVDGAEGLLLADSEHLGSALVWQRDGTVYVLAGQVESADLLVTAQSLP